MNRSTLVALIVIIILVVAGLFFFGYLGDRGQSDSPASPHAIDQSP